MISWLCHRFGVRSKPEPRFSYSTFLVSSVPGTPLQIPLFSYPPHRRIGQIESQLTAVQARYGLSDLYLYRSATGISAICLRTYPVRRLEKIIKASGSADYRILLKYNHIFFRVGTVRDEDQNLISGPPEYVKTLPAPEENNARFISRPHYHFMKDFIPAVREYPRMHGEGTVILTYTVNEK